MDWNQLRLDHFAAVDCVFGPLREPAIRAAAAIADAFRAGHKVLACGNGGSAADAQHFSTASSGSTPPGPPSRSPPILRS